MMCTVNSQSINIKCHTNCTQVYTLRLTVLYTYYTYAIHILYVGVCASYLSIDQPKIYQIIGRVVMVRVQNSPSPYFHRQCDTVTFYTDCLTQSHSVYMIWYPVESGTIETETTWTI